jgi:hypothetical protein
MQPKSIIFQFDKGDQNVPNPISSAMLRAGDLADRATYFRHDLAFAERPNLPRNGHTFMTSIGNPAWRDIALGAQEQIATFLASDGTEIIHPEPARFFETPIQGPLPEDLSFITGPLPKALLTINRATVTSGESGTVTAVFTVDLAAPSSLLVTVHYATADGSRTATAADHDYLPTSGPLTFAPGETTKTITVAVRDDREKDVEGTGFVNDDSPYRHRFTVRRRPEGNETNFPRVSLTDFPWN